MSLLLICVLLLIIQPKLTRVVLAAGRRVKCHRWIGDVRGVVECAQARVLTGTIVVAQTSVGGRVEYGQLETI